MKNRALISAFTLIVLLGGCTSTETRPTPPAPVTQVITVFAAASLTEAFKEMGQQFEAQHPETELVFNFGGSQQLAQQINQGARADIFASANRKQLDAVSSHVVSDTLQIFAHNRLVVISPHDHPLPNLAALAQPGLKIILAAQEVPVGQYSLDFLEKAAQEPTLGVPFRDGVLNNVVSYEENVRSILTKVALGEGDAGLVYASDLSGEAEKKVGRLDIPDTLNTLAAYPIARLNSPNAAPHIQQFIDYVMSPAGQAILVKHGFIAIH